MPSDPPRFDTAEAAEAAFYAAFESADLEAMMNVWDEADDIVCVHPMGPRLEGRAAVAESWRRLFSGGPSLRFEPVDRQVYPGRDLAVHCLHEDIRHGPGHGQQSRVIATNVYRHTAQGWRMIMHHATPADSVAQKPPGPPGTVH